MCSNSEQRIHVNNDTFLISQQFPQASVRTVHIRNILSVNVIFVHYTRKFIAALIMPFSEGFYIGDHLKVNKCDSFSHINGTFFTSNLKTMGAPLNTIAQCASYNFMYSARHCYDYLRI
jgi:hypothetical protein